MKNAQVILLGELIKYNHANNLKTLAKRVRNGVIAKNAVRRIKLFKKLDFQRCFLKIKTKKERQTTKKARKMARNQPI